MTDPFPPLLPPTLKTMCMQCGNEFRARPCGFGHAAIRLGSGRRTPRTRRRAYEAHGVTERTFCPWCRNGPRRWFTSTNGPNRAIACVVCGANGTVGCETLLPPTLNDVLTCTACACSLLGSGGVLFLATGPVHLECA